MPAEKHEYVHRILIWVTFLPVRLSLFDLAEAVAFDLNRAPVFDENDKIEDPQDIIGMCRGLITLIPSEDTNSDDRDEEPSATSTPHGFQKVALSHFSVEEFLLSDQLRTTLPLHSLDKSIGRLTVLRSCMHGLLRSPRPDSVE